MRYIYITTNNVNGMRYLGQRKAPKGKTPETDSYLGSGTNLLKAIKKYGKENFSKQIIHICTSQLEADALEIAEIEVRSILKRKVKWYNIASGGQYGRTEQHSELTSKSMKHFYSTKEGKEALKKIQEVKKDKKEKKIKCLYGDYMTIELFNQQKLMIKSIKRLSRRFKIKTNLIHRQHLKENKTLMTKSDIAKMSWTDKESRIQSLIKGQQRRNDKGNYHSNESLLKYRDAKLKKHNNLLGLYIVNNCNINYKLIQSKIKRVVSINYKNEQNMINQLEAIRAIVFNECNVDIQIDLLIDLCKQTKAIKNV